MIPSFPSGRGYMKPLSVLFLEITVEKTLETLSVAGFILGHFVNGVVDGVPVHLFGALGDAHFVCTSAAFGHHSLFQVGLGIPDHLTE